jgi:NitT/TauT family transport system substrate-binding protein
MSGTGPFEPVRFNAFPEMKEAFISNNLQATFMIAPLVMKMREQNTRVKIVYLGHRDGTTLMVHKDSNIHRIEDLVGKKIAIPSRYSNQYLILFKAFKERGLKIDPNLWIEMPPPEMPAALFTRTAIDAIIAGEPLMAKTEMDGYGRVLFMTKDVWPDFISCVLAVREDVIAQHRPEVQSLVDGIARSGLWIDEDKDTGMTHRLQAAEIAAQKQYYNQKPELIRFVLSKPPDRVKYTNLRVRRKDFEEIEHYGRQAGIFTGATGFDDYADTSFVPENRALQPWQWELKK